MASIAGALDVRMGISVGTDSRTDDSRMEWTLMSSDVRAVGSDDTAAVSLAPEGVVAVPCTVGVDGTKGAGGVRMGTGGGTGA
jgi:hypothetical protein